MTFGQLTFYTSQEDHDSTLKTLREWLHEDDWFCPGQDRLYTKNDRLEYVLRLAAADLVTRSKLQSFVEKGVTKDLFEYIPNDDVRRRYETEAVICLDGVLIHLRPDGTYYLEDPAT